MTVLFLAFGAHILYTLLTPTASAAALNHRQMRAFVCDTRFARFFGLTLSHFPQRFTMIYNRFELSQNLRWLEKKPFFSKVMFCQRNKLYFYVKIGFSLVLYLKLRHFHTQGIRRTLTSATGFGLPHRFATWFIVLAICLDANGLWGRELFAFICVRQSKASGR